jgi:hypothetical protein
LSGAGIGHENSLELSVIILNKYNYDNKKLLFYNGVIVKVIQDYEECWRVSRGPDRSGAGGAEERAGLFADDVVKDRQRMACMPVCK